MSEQQRQFLTTLRQCLIMMLGALEDYLGMERSIIPKRKREMSLIEARAELAHLKRQAAHETK